MSNQPRTVAESEAIPLDQRLEMTKAAKGGTWYDDWRPYCMMCRTMNRMPIQSYGFKCMSCGNMIGWDLTRLVESPLNL